MYNVERIIMIDVLSVKSSTKDAQILKQKFSIMTLLIIDCMYSTDHILMMYQFNVRMKRTYTSITTSI